MEIASTNLASSTAFSSDPPEIRSRISEVWRFKSSRPRTNSTEEGPLSAGPPTSSGFLHEVRYRERMLNAAIHARNSRASLDYKAPGQKDCCQDPIHGRLDLLRPFVAANMEPARSSNAPSRVQLNRGCYAFNFPLPFNQQSHRQENLAGCALSGYRKWSTIMRSELMSAM